MIDSIQINIPNGPRMRSDLPHILQNHFSIDVNPAPLPKRKHDRATTRTVIVHRASETRFLAIDGTLVTIKCELPKLLHGHNGQLIKSAKELEDALQRLWILLSWVLEPNPTPCNLIVELSRVDLCWHWPDPKGILAGELVRTGTLRVRGQPKGFGNGNFTYKGSTAGIGLYDKVEQLKDMFSGHLIEPREGGILRLEFREKTPSGNAVLVKVAEDISSTALWEACRTAYLEEVAKFRITKTPGKAASKNRKNIAAWAAVVLKQGWDAFDLYAENALTKDSAAKNRQEIRRQLNKAAYSPAALDFMRMVNTGTLPAAVDVQIPEYEDEYAKRWNSLLAIDCRENCQAEPPPPGKSYGEAPSILQPPPERVPYQKEQGTLAVAGIDPGLRRRVFTVNGKNPWPAPELPVRVKRPRASAAS